MTDADESYDQAYLEGRRRAWLTMFHECLRQLGIDDVDVGNAKWVLERQETVAMLRILCRDHGDNDWPDNLHLADVVEKHLIRPMVSR